MASLLSFQNDVFTLLKLAGAFQVGGRKKHSLYFEAAATDSRFGIYPDRRNPVYLDFPVALIYPE